MTIPFETGSLALYTAAGADTNGVVTTCDGFATVCVQLSGTITSATIYWEGTVDDSNWIGVLGWNRTTGVKALTATAAGLYVINVTGLSQFRARLDWTTGSVTAYAKFSSIPITTLVTAS
jgi:hypothetical protein